MNLKHKTEDYLNNGKKKNGAVQLMSMTHYNRKKNENIN